MHTYRSSARLFLLFMGTSGIVAMLNAPLWFSQGYRSPGTLAWLLSLVALAETYHRYRTHRSRVRRARAGQHTTHRNPLSHGGPTLADLQAATIHSLSSAIHARDQYTHQHMQRVYLLTQKLAQRMQLSAEEYQAVSTGALLHDIGKLAIPDSILLKPGPLTAEEFARIKRHPVIGAEILAPVPFPGPVLPIVRHHHERWDGGGYPDGLKGEAIPRGARILAVIDVFDALVSDRTYSPGWDWKEATAYIRENAGIQFDPEVVDAFLDIIASGEADMLLQKPRTPSLQTDFLPDMPAPSDAPFCAVAVASTGLSQADATCLRDTAGGEEGACEPQNASPTVLRLVCAESEKHSLPCKDEPVLHLLDTEQEACRAKHPLIMISTDYAVSTNRTLASTPAFLARPLLTLICGGKTDTTLLPYPVLESNTAS